MTGYLNDEPLEKAANEASDDEEDNIEDSDESSNEEDGSSDGNETVDTDDVPSDEESQSEEDSDDDEEEEDEDDRIPVPKPIKLNKKGNYHNLIKDICFCPKSYNLAASVDCGLGDSVVQLLVNVFFNY